MTDFTKTTNFTVKDSLHSVILGAEIDTEFDNIAVAIATKVDSTDTIAVASGGTGATTAVSARANLGVVMAMHGGALNVAAATATLYVDFNGRAAPLGTLNDTVKSICALTGTLKNFRFKAGYNNLSANLTVNLLKNGASTGITVTVTASSTSLFTDAVNTVSVTAGDVLSVQTVSASGTGAISHASWSAEV